MKKMLLLCCSLWLTQLAWSAADSKPAANTAALEKSGFSGKVVETINAATYTYVRVDTGKGQVWAAAPQFVVKVGDTVAIPDGMAMKNYQSKTLKRTFDVVYFTGAITVNGAKPVAPPAPNAGQLPAGHPPIAGANPGNAAAGLPAGHPPIDGAAAQPGKAEMPKDHPPIAGQKAPMNISGIKKADKTVAEIYAEKAKLNGKQIRLRGKVVKYNEMIMGKNWLHIQDGSGAVGNNDLVVTSASGAKVGDTVLVTGKVAINKDFGSNYKYDVIMEESSITVE